MVPAASPQGQLSPRLRFSSSRWLGTSRSPLPTDPRPSVPCSPPSCSVHKQQAKLLARFHLPPSPANPVLLFLYFSRLDCIVSQQLPLGKRWRRQAYRSLRRNHFFKECARTGLGCAHGCPLTTSASVVAKFCVPWKRRAPSKQTTITTRSQPQWQMKQGLP